MEGWGLFERIAKAIPKIEEHQRHEQWIKDIEEQNCCKSHLDKREKLHIEIVDLE